MKESVYVYVQCIQFAVHLKLTQDYKLTLLQLKKKNKPEDTCFKTNEETRAILAISN